MKKSNKTKMPNIDLKKFNVVLTPVQVRVMLVTIIILVIVLLFRKQFHSILERVIVFTILFLLFLIISKNIMVTLISSLIIFLLVNLIINTRDTIEKFDNLTASADIKSSTTNDIPVSAQTQTQQAQTTSPSITASTDDKDEASKIKDFINNLGTMPELQNLISNEPVIDLNKFNTPEVQTSSKGIEKLLQQVNGGIELKEDDLKETTDKLNINPATYSNDSIPNSLKVAQKESYELIDTVKALQDTLGTLSPVLQEGKKLMGLFESLKL
jgi:hypothetical protein